MDSVVAVLSYRRVELLRTLLPELARQARALPTAARVLVVDNDPLGLARVTVEQLGLPEVEYRHEPRPGIAAARNAAIDAAATASTLVFIDDDETPSGNWLASLVEAQGTHGGAAIAGSVVRTYETEPAQWIRAARVFDRYRLASGSPVEAASTANLLLDLNYVRQHGLRFDDRLGLSGGSDYLFTRQISASGGRIYWCDEAVVFDPVPASRLTARWTLQRGYRSGNSRAVVSVILAGRTIDQVRVRSHMIGGGLMRMAGGSARAAFGLATRSSTHEGQGAWTFVRGAGMIGGALGHRFVEYRRAQPATSGSRRP